MFKNHFLLDRSEYKRDIDVISNATIQTAQYLATMTGDSYDDCLAYVRSQVKKDSVFDLKNPTVVHTTRVDMADRIVEETPLTTYLTNVNEKSLILAPTMTAYLNHDTFESPHVSFMASNKKKRSIAKNEGFDAKAKGLMEIYEQKDKVQGAKKIANNSLSGGQATESTVLYNKSAHSTLTSATRTTSSIANANNDKLLGGKRHYFDLDVIMNNIASTVSVVNMDSLEMMIVKYGLVYPSVKQTMECVLNSSRVYFRDERRENIIYEYVSRLTRVERAAFVYVGDLWQVRRLNPDFMRHLLEELSAKVTDITYEDRVTKMYAVPEYISFFSHCLCYEEARGLGKDYVKFEEQGKLNTVLATSYNIQYVVDKYADFFKEILVNRTMPASIAHYPDAVREVVTMSDTDSTIFTLNEWVIWYYGKTKMGPDVFIRDAVLFIASASISHLLAMMSANFGTVPKMLNAIAMKSEFVFDVFIPMNVTKHYIAGKSSQEGNIFEALELEIKGVHLKNSNNPKEINDAASRMITEIIETVYANNPISILKYIYEVAAIEKEIIRSIEAGETKFYRIAKVKDAESYADDEDRSPYKQYTLYRKVFEAKYGEIPPPPYAAIKVATILDKPRNIKTFVNEHPDRDFANRFLKWWEVSERNIGTMYIPNSVVTSRGVPTEIMHVIDKRGIVEDICYVFYMILGALGYEHRPLTLISDFY